MYKEYYGLCGEPFSKSIPTSEFYKSSGFNECLSRLDYMKNKRGVILLTGKPGTGKSSCLRAFLDKLNPSHYKSVYLPLSSVSTIEFYRQLNHGLGGEFIHRKSDLFLSIQNLIMNYNKNSNIVPVIIFDEAQFLKSENLFELQMMFNFKVDSYDPALIVLCGQNHLNEKLNRPPYHSINQRISLKYNLNPLTEDETKEYIEYHLKLKGRKEKLFNENALLSIFKLSNGIKRMINQICLKSLIYGSLKKAETIDEEMIYQAAKELN